MRRARRQHVELRSRAAYQCVLHLIHIFFNPESYSYNKFPSEAPECPSSALLGATLGAAHLIMAHTALKQLTDVGLTSCSPVR